MTPEEEALRVALREYLCGHITSREKVREIEGLLSEIDDNPLFEELEDLVALYNPGGGPEYADEAALHGEIRWLLTELGEDVTGC
jgi:hypothetical protein